ncbi:protein of unknown function [Friedmanniella luteola]|uniref:DUF4395 domain-containing protein n=1 Tax=Friedmanniella luteola TaxID=546871 RepID=A0A1H1Y8F1_9ACTN|nr:DUF4395 domain-containing protein [Friedmanniella luteola]SDT17730.1 protein of unknown function [Friedmanniella luteola]
METPAWATFPHPVNELAARTVAGGVALLTAVTLATQAWWLVPLLVLGFAARVLAGPRFSVLGRLATQVVAPRLGPARMVPGPPKRFAQAIGLVLTAVAVVAAAAGTTALTAVLLVILLVFALLESVVGFCAGCWVFGLLMRWGWVSEETCADCQDIGARYGRQPAGRS